MRVFVTADVPPEVAARIAQLTREHALALAVPGVGTVVARLAGHPGQAVPVPFEQCPHLVAVGYTDPDACPEQQGLAPGQVRCLGCCRVFTSDLDWCRAQDRMMEGVTRS